jgi:nucleotide-binding universal stress UspA family protein
MDTVTRASRGIAAPNRTSVTRIAAGVDGLREGEDAAALAATLAKVTGAELMLVAIHSDPLILPPIGSGWRDLRKEARAMLRRARAEFAPNARTTVETDFSVPRGLQRVIHREHRDLLVMGSSRLAPEGRVRIGKRTRQLLSHFDCPLAVAPRGFRDRDRAVIERVGVGYDGGPEAQAALELGASIAAAAGARLEVDAVVDDRVPSIAWSRFAHGGAEHPRWEDAVLGEIERRRVEAEAAAREVGVPGHVQIKRGRPADALLELSGSVDLLLVGSRRWGPVSRVLLGSTGEALLHDCACPVLVVPRPGG